MITIDDIHSNNDWRCARCGAQIDTLTYSGWEVFVDKLTTQPLCVWCSVVESFYELTKATDDDPSDTVS